MTAGRWFVAVTIAGASLALASCSSAPRALTPTEEVVAATASSTLAFDQYRQGTALPTVTETALSDMLTAIADAEGTLVELPPTSAEEDAALDAVRDAADAVARALDAVRDGTRGDNEAITDGLESATDGLEEATTALDRRS